jgi:2-keto-4-pentenoate hydratase/2-oxohepta-3-ene-1,7-dioic acid hydratase in catechol pathway
MSDQPDLQPNSPPNIVAEAVLLDRHRIRIRSIFGIGRNYAAHARELGNAIPKEPVVFLKPLSALIEDGDTILLPPESEDVQHEVEVVLLLGSGGRHLSSEQAWSLIAGYGVGIDVTARDLQRKAQSEGRPWTIAKGYDTFAPVSRFVPADRVGNPRALNFDLSVNGALRQSGNTRDMMFDCGEIIAYLSTIFTLQSGDLIFTGTPEGVAAIAAGDVLCARLPDYGTSLTVGVKTRV